MSERDVAGYACPLQVNLEGGAAGRGGEVPRSRAFNVTEELQTKPSSSAPSFTVFSSPPVCLFSFFSHSTSLVAVIMSFETTATIASFGGKLLKLKHKSSSTTTDMALNLYLPPQALKSGAKVPVLFYLSGLTCTGDNCSEKGFFQHGASEKGIAVVYPDTSPSACVRLAQPETKLSRI